MGGVAGARRGRCFRPGWYFVKWRTELAHWDEASTTLETVLKLDCVLPWLVPTSREPTVSTTQGSLYPVLTTRGENGLDFLGVATDKTTLVRLLLAIGKSK